MTGVIRLVGAALVLFGLISALLAWAKLRAGGGFSLGLLVVAALLFLAGLAVMLRSPALAARLTDKDGE